MKRVTLLPLVASIALAVNTFAQNTQPSTGVSTTGPNAQELKATVTAVQGLVRVRLSEDAPFKPAEVGMVVGQNAEFQTGLRSAVQFVIPPDQTITLDRLGTVKVLTAVNDGGRIKTNIGMKYGRTRYQIEAAGREHEATISSPSSTLAVRGTDFMDYDQRPFPAVATSFSGRVDVRGFKRRMSVGSKGGSKARVDANSSSPAEYAKGQAVVDPSIALARTEAESDLIAALVYGGATVSYDYEKGIRVIRGGRPRSDKELIPVLPGTLNFVLRWNGDADLNLGVISPQTDAADTNNRTVYPLGGVNLTKNGGETSFDHRGGKNGGMEVAFWGKNFPLGIYRLGVVYISGVQPMPATIDAFLDGKRVDIFTSQGPVQTARVDAEPINPVFGAGIAVGTVRLLDAPKASESAKVKAASRKATVIQPAARKR
jgi:hypothetical protein